MTMCSVRINLTYDQNDFACSVSLSQIVWLLSKVTKK